MKLVYRIEIQLGFSFGENQTSHNFSTASAIDALQRD